jgi:hypothetical protein
MSGQLVVYRDPASAGQTTTVATPAIGDAPLQMFRQDNAYEHWRTTIFSRPPVDLEQLSYADLARHAKPATEILLAIDNTVASPLGGAIDVDNFILAARCNQRMATGRAHVVRLTYQWSGDESRSGVSCLFPDTKYETKKFYGITVGLDHIYFKLVVDAENSIIKITHVYIVRSNKGGYVYLKVHVSHPQVTFAELMRLVSEHNVPPAEPAKSVADQQHVTVTEPLDVDARGTAKGKLKRMTTRDTEEIRKQQSRSEDTYKQESDMLNNAVRVVGTDMDTNKKVELDDNRFTRMTPPDLKKFAQTIENKRKQLQKATARYEAAKGDYFEWSKQLLHKLSDVDRKVKNTMSGDDKLAAELAVVIRTIGSGVDTALDTAKQWLAYIKTSVTNAETIINRDRAASTLAAGKHKSPPKRFHVKSVPCVNDVDIQY